MTEQHTSSVAHYFEPKVTAAPVQSVAAKDPVMLNLKRETGDEKAFRYSHLVWADFNPSKGILIHLSNHCVLIKGRNLEGVYKELVAGELREIIEVPPARDLAQTEKPVVHKWYAWTLPEPKGDPWDLIPKEMK